MATTVPGWQTEELQDEWPDLESEAEDDELDLSYGTRSVSLTAPLSSQIYSSADFQPNPTLSQQPNPIGTFVVREDVPNAPFLPKTPGRNKNFVKGFFTPLPLERMFEPPSPPIGEQTADPTPLSHSVQVHSSSQPGPVDEVKTDAEPKINSFQPQKTSMSCQFTFSVPRVTSSRLKGVHGGAFPQAQSTPIPPLPHTDTAPPTDPRLRLFQFQYDTYTREHLSALVDSIAVNTPSGTGTTPTPTSLSHGLSRVSRAPTVPPHLRSSKRIKLSPANQEESVLENVVVSRPIRRDYVGESRSLMEQIKLARDFSTISTVASAQTGSPSVVHDVISHKNPNINFTAQPSVPEHLNIPSSSIRTANSTIGSYSSTSYRQKAAALMEQIKSDVKRQKRICPDDSEISHLTTQVDDTTNSLSGSFKLRSEGKENLVQPVSTRRTSSKLNSSRSTRRSPRKSNKQDVGEVDLVVNLSRITIQDPRPIINFTLTPPTIINPLNVDLQPQSPGGRSERRQTSSNLAAPSYPSIRLNTNEDLNRFVSSSTASGTTLTAGNAPSFVKHAGPAHIRTIAPTDLPSLPERFGNMFFDRNVMKWVKSSATVDPENIASRTDTSEDPFGDIESLRDESGSGPEDLTNPDIKDGMNVRNIVEMTRIDERPEVEDEEEMELSNFSTDASAHIVQIMTGVETDEYEDETTDSESTNDDIHTATQAVINDIDFDSEFEDSPSRNNLSVAEVGPQAFGRISPQRLVVAVTTLSSAVVAATTTPSRAKASAATTPVIKSALKSNSATPTSALKNGNRSRFHTPNTNAHRRSVSFSDGKKDGPIQDIEASAAPSVRTRRIGDMMAALEESDLDESPSKTSSAGRPERLQPLTSRNAPLGGPASGHSPRRVFSRTYSQRQSPGRSLNAKANATFLTECSFGVAHDRLVEVITDVQPFEPYWDQLASIDLSNAKLESVARLKEFLPQLDTLNLNHNDLAWLSGVPGTVRTLSVAHNCLTGITSYSHLLNIENLDISHNEVDSLRQLECLRRLRELKADGNKIQSLDGLDRMNGLVKLSLERNDIRVVDLEQYQWARLQMLNISHNRIDNLRGLVSLQSLIALNIDSNSLKELDISGVMSRLRILRVSCNRLRGLDVRMMPNLRTLYADNNTIGVITNLHKLTRLENVSLRNQGGSGLKLLTRDVRDVKRLYLSGNPLKGDFLKEACYNLIYLELAACRLTVLPEGMSRLLPNLRVLNLNYNFLEDVEPLAGLRRLEKLTIIGSRLKSTKPLIRLAAEMPDAEMLDFRMNPCTLGWYLPLLVQDVRGALQPCDGGKEGWEELDRKFRLDLPDAGYIGRLAYRGLIMRGCGGLRVLDGVRISEKERRKAEELLVGILGRRGK